jgi:hypothetical protein
MLKNISFRADNHLTSKAGGKAQAENTTLNFPFRDTSSNRDKKYRALVKQLSYARAKR